MGVCPQPSMGIGVGWGVGGGEGGSMLPLAVTVRATLHAVLDGM